MWGGLGVSALQNEEDVPAMHSLSSGQEETAVRTSSRTAHYGPRGGIMWWKKGWRGENNL